MKTTHKKLIGGLLVCLLIATVGAALATGQTDEKTSNTTDKTITDTTPERPAGGHQGMMGFGMVRYNLTDEQRTELEDLMTSLREQNATPDEMRTAIQEKLDEFGVLDTQLDNEIAQTEQRLTILYRQKELRNEGYSWDEINGIIEDEFGLQNATGTGWDIMGGHGGFGHGPNEGPRDCMIPEESDQ
jgi:Spy/CpxP family protein refolding chaperone